MKLLLLFSLIFLVYAPASIAAWELCTKADQEKKMWVERDPSKPIRSLIIDRIDHGARFAFSIFFRNDRNRTRFLGNFAEFEFMNRNTLQPNYRLINELDDMELTVIVPNRYFNQILEILRRIDPTLPTIVVGVHWQTSNSTAAQADPSMHTKPGLPPGGSSS